jgi:hypothetical protein
VFAFELTNAKGEKESWYLDFKDKGVVGRGAAPEGGKADGMTLLIIYVCLLYMGWMLADLC